MKKHILHLEQINDLCSIDGYDLLESNQISFNNSFCKGLNLLEKVFLEKERESYFDCFTWQNFQYLVAFDSSSTFDKYLTSEIKNLSLLSEGFNSKVLYRWEVSNNLNNFISDGDFDMLYNSLEKHWDESGFDEKVELNSSLQYIISTLSQNDDIFEESFNKINKKKLLISSNII